MSDDLEAYREKRDFTRSPEPEGAADVVNEQPIFVIQKHDARSLHYDFRLEVNGVLKSWAVPKGPSADPSVKRLAVATEDHPLEYALFEGIIPDGEYGAGAVIVWDKGHYVNVTEKKGHRVNIEDALDHGHVTVWLEGVRLKGAYSLNRFRTGKQAQWLLIKVKDEHADSRDLLNEIRDSVLTGRTLEELSDKSETPGLAARPDVHKKRPRKKKDEAV